MIPLGTQSVISQGDQVSSSWITMLNIWQISMSCSVFRLRQLVEETTRVTHEAATHIDQIATTCARNIVKTGVYGVSLNGHFLVYCI